MANSLTTRLNRLIAGNHTDAELKELKYVQKLVEAKYESAIGDKIAHPYTKKEIAVKVYLGMMRFSDAIEKMLMAHPKLNGARLSRIENDRLVTLKNKIRADHADYYVSNDNEPYSAEELAV